MDLCRSSEPPEILGGEMLPHPPRSFTLPHRSVSCQGDSPGFICQSGCLVCLRPAPAAPTPPHHGPNGPRRTGAGAPAGGARSGPGARAAGQRPPGAEERGPQPAGIARKGEPAAAAGRPTRHRAARRAARANQGGPEGPGLGGPTPGRGGAAAAPGPPPPPGGAAGGEGGCPGGPETGERPRR